MVARLMLVSISWLDQTLLAYAPNAEGPGFNRIVGVLTLPEIKSQHPCTCRTVLRATPVKSSGAPIDQGSWLNITCGMKF